MTSSRAKTSGYGTLRTRSAPASIPLSSIWETVPGAGLGGRLRTRYYRSDISGRLPRAHLLSGGSPGKRLRRARLSRRMTRTDVVST